MSLKSAQKRRFRFLHPIGSPQIVNIVANQQTDCAHSLYAKQHSTMLHPLAK